MGCASFDTSPLVVKAGANKQCRGTCHKWVGPESFCPDQLTCKVCFNAEKKMARRAKQQGVSEWLSSLKQEQPKVFNNLSNTFNRHLSKRITSRNGERLVGRSEMMWGREFVEFMAETALGNMSGEESRERWNAMLRDPKVRKDAGGHET